MTPRNKFYKVNRLDKNGILFKKKKYNSLSHKY